MIKHIPFGSEAFTAVLGTLMRSLLLVDQHMDLQVRSVVKLLSTAWERTDKGALRLVVGDVGQKPRLHSEGLVALIVSALENCLASLFVDLHWYLDTHLDRGLATASRCLSLSNYAVRFFLPFLLKPSQRKSHVSQIKSLRGQINR